MGKEPRKHRQSVIMKGCGAAHTKTSLTSQGRREQELGEGGLNSHNTRKTDDRGTRVVFDLTSSWRNPNEQSRRRF